MVWVVSPFADEGDHVVGDVSEVAGDLGGGGVGGCVVHGYMMPGVG